MVVTLNDEKCVFSTTTVKFLGHIVDKFGIRADPVKTMAINKMAQPTNVTELRRFMGMINQLGNFSPNLASITQPLRELMSSKSAWIWGPAQEQSFQASKDELSKPTVLALYNPESKTKLSADASSYGLGAVLLQEHDHEWKPVVYASRSLTETESRYAQIEKEALSITWGCEKFSDYILGKNILIETDHKPLVPLLSSKHLDSLPPRVLRFRLRLMRFSFSIIHVPGKFMYTSDALSRAPVETADKNSTALQDEVECHIASITSGFPATKHQLEIYRTAQARNPITETLIKYTKFGWPEKHKLPSTIKPYWSVRGQITLHNELLLFGNRIVVPKELQDDVLEKIHQGHQGILKCRLRAMSAVWWPGISKDVENLVKDICASRVPPKKEPMIASDLPLYPWQKVGADLFELKGTKYLLVIDYFSRYVEIAKLTSTYSGVVIGHLKTIFSRFGIPEVVVSDNGPQFVSHEMKAFAVSYNFEHVTSSPRYPQGNGLAERAVQTMKNMLTTKDDVNLCLLSYRTTPMPWCGHSPAELLMGRQLRTQVPRVQERFIPEWSYLKELKKQHKAYKGKQADYDDVSHRVRERPDLGIGSEVWVTNLDDKREPTRGVVSSQAETPRSYVVHTPSGPLRRNSQHLRTVPEERTAPEGPTPEDGQQGL